MKLENFAITFLVVFALFVPGAFAGPRDTGGGNALVKLDEKGAIKEARLLDLYEGQVMMSLQYKEWDSSLEPYDIAKTVLSRLDQSIGSNLVTWKLDEVHSKFKFLPKGIGLKPIADHSVVTLPKDWQVVQLAAFYHGGDGFVYVDSDVWEKLSLADQAALIVHEVVYSFLRFNRETDSDRTRKLVALGFSTLEIPGVTEGFPESDPAEVCETINDDGSQQKHPIARFRTIPSSDGTVKAQFLYIKEQITLVQSYVVGRGAWPISQTKNFTASFNPLVSLMQPNQQVNILLITEPVGDFLGVIQFWNGEKAISAKFKCAVY